MNNKRWLGASILLIFFIGGYGASFFFKKPLQNWRPPQSEISLSTHSLHETLSFLELTNQKNTLHPDWYELIDPITYVVSNGIIQSITGYLLLDLNRPVHISLAWNNKDKSPKKQYPTLLLVLPSNQGIQAAENLARNLRNYGKIQESDLRWHGVFTFPSVPKTMLSWEGKRKHILLAWNPETTSEPFLFSSFYTEENPQENITLSWNTKKVPQNPFFSRKNMIFETLQFHCIFKERTLSFSAEGTWNGTKKQKGIIPKTLIAGWNFMGIPPLQIHKTSNKEICIAGGNKKIQKRLSITKKCDLKSIDGWFFLASTDFFQHINLPLLHIQLDIWSTKTKIWMEGTLEKKKDRVLFPLYIWLYKLFTEK